jgi:hypothetical protein
MLATGLSLQWSRGIDNYNKNHSTRSFYLHLQLNHLCRHTRLKTNLKQIPTTDKDQWTPLHVTALKRNEVLIKLLRILNVGEMAHQTVCCEAPAQHGAAFTTIKITVPLRRNLPSTYTLRFASMVSPTACALSVPLDSSLASSTSLQGALKDASSFTSTAASRRYDKVTHGIY